MTADQSPDLVTARCNVEWWKEESHVCDLPPGAHLPHPAPAQSSEQEVVAPGDGNTLGWEYWANKWYAERDAALARLAALPTALTSDAAVEAAAQTMFDVWIAECDGAVDPGAWDDIDSWDRELWRKQVRAALTVALATLPTEGGE